jgi:hypothetical protein
MTESGASSHSAEAVALGFYFQSLYALRTILEQPGDDATICLERLDDVELIANGLPLLVQLKHSIVAAPPPVTIHSKALWRTLKAWIDVLPKVPLNDTRFQLVSVAPLDPASPLHALLHEGSNRDALHSVLVAEAERVLKERSAASAVHVSPLPHGDRASGCQAFLKLDEVSRRALLNRIVLRPGASNISSISNEIASQLINFPPTDRTAISARLIEWWDLQVVFSLCGKRERFIGKIEVQQKTAELAAELERDELFPDFESAILPSEHTPDSMLVRQIELVGGSASDLRVAVREEWRARAQRHKWSEARLDMAVRIALYDELLEESWLDKHERLIEDCAEATEATNRSKGLSLLRWSHEKAHTEVRPFAGNWNYSYYVRGSYQILAIGLQVGWHPQFRELLKDVK